jgi:hypothetical protein
MFFCSKVLFLPEMDRAFCNGPVRIREGPVVQIGAGGKALEGEKVVILFGVGNQGLLSGE